MKQLFILLVFFIATNCCAQNLIPFQIQNKNQWDNNAKWGYMTADKKVVLAPVFYGYTPPVIKEQYLIYGNKIMDLKTGKIVWDSIEAKNVNEIRGNIVSIKMPLRGAVNYQPYSFKNIKTKKLIADEGRFADIRGFVVIEGSGSEGVVDENGKVVIPKKIYQKIVREKIECFVTKNEYDALNDVYNTKGVKLNNATYTDFDFGSYQNCMIVAKRLIDKTKNINEIVFLNNQGKEVGPHLFYKKSNDKYAVFEFTRSGYCINKTDVVLYTNKNCDEASQLKKNVVINNNGKVIINSNDYEKIVEIDTNLFYAIENETKKNSVINANGTVIINTAEYKDIKTISEGLFTGIGNDDKKYLLNTKGAIVANVGIMQADQVYSLSPSNFMVYKRNIRKLFFYTYDVKTGISQSKEFVQMADGIDISLIETGFNKYYLVRVADKNKKQYASYVYDNNGKLLQNSEDGLWMFYDGYLIKYLMNNKGDRLYLGYYDSDFKPYSTIK